MFYLFVYCLIFHQYLNDNLFVICFDRTDSKSIHKHFNLPGLLFSYSHQAYSSSAACLAQSPVYSGRQSGPPHSSRWANNCWWSFAASLLAQDFYYYSFFFYISSMFYCSGEETEEKRLYRVNDPADKQREGAQPGDNTSQVTPAISQQSSGSRQ